MNAFVPPGLNLKNPAHLIAFGFGAGLSPKAPGTMGTLLGFPLFLALSSFLPAVQMSILVVLFLIGIWLCDVTGKAIGEADHSGIVVDEFVCFAMVLVFTPSDPYWMIAAFAVFRFFDIVKIWPASWIDNNLKNGFGVMADDLIAAMFSILLILVSRYLLT